jgi:hypothetical protein
VFIALLLLLVVLNIGYTIGAVPVMDTPNVGNWIATSWYMAVTVMFFAMVISEDTEARVDMLRRGLIMGGMIAALAGIAGYFNLVPGGRDLLTLYDRARGTFKDPNVLGAFLILPASVLQASLRPAGQIAAALHSASSRWRSAAFSARPGGHIITATFNAGADGPDQPLAGTTLAHHCDGVVAASCRAPIAVLLSFDPSPMFQAARQLRPEL